MKPTGRVQVILDLVEHEGGVSIADLAGHLAVSGMTVRRDTERLERSGALRRVRGRAGLADRETVVLDGGSTGVAVARELVARELTVRTPSLLVADVLRDAPNIRLMLTGGIMRRGEESLVGPAASATLEEHRFDSYLMAVSGIDPQHGCTEWNVDDAVVQRVALRRRRLAAAGVTVLIAQ